MRRWIGFAAMLVVFVGLALRRGPSLRAGHEEQAQPSLEPFAQESTRTPDGASPSADLLRVGGVLLARGSRAPIAGALVRLSSEGVEAHTTTDAVGRFELELDSARWQLGETVAVEASHGETRQTVFAGQLALAPELTLVGRARFRLHGRLVTESAFGDDERAPLALALTVPAAFDGIGSLAGTTRLDRARRFELEVWLESLPPSFQLTFASGSAQLLALDVPGGTLVSPAGATIRLPLVRLEVHVVDERGLPLVGAEVRVEPLPLELGAANLREESADNGFARFRVPPGEAELAVELAGRALHVERIELPAGTGRAQRVVLRGLGPEDRVEGQVVDEHGRALAQARVWARPRTLEPALFDAQEQRSDAEGRFSFALAANAPLEIRAEREDLGASRALDVPPVQGGARELRLVIEPGGRLRVRVEGLAAGKPASGGFEWLCVDAQGQVESGRAWNRMFELEAVPAGQVELFVRAFGNARFGMTSVRIVPGENEITLALQPVARVRGMLLERDGTPAAGRALTLEGHILPAAAAAHFAHSRSDGLGGFDLLLGTSSSGVLVVQRPGAEPVRFPVSANGSFELRLP